MSRIYYRKAAVHNNTYVGKNSKESKIEIDSLLFSINKKLPEFPREGLDEEFTAGFTYVPIHKVLETLNRLKDEGERICFLYEDYEVITRLEGFDHKDVLFQMCKEGYFKDSSSLERQARKTTWEGQVVIGSFVCLLIFLFYFEFSMGKTTRFC